MPEPSLLLLTSCYGGQAHIVYMRSLLAFEAACAARGLALRIGLSGGEALVGRARGGALGGFLRSDHSHLLLVDADMGFQPDDIFRLLAAGKDVAGVTSGGGLRPVEAVEPGLLLITRQAAQRMAEGYPELAASLRDLHRAGNETSPMVFDSLLDADGRYLSDLEAFCRRWRDLGGEVWGDGGLSVQRVAEVAWS